MTNAFRLVAAAALAASLVAHAQGTGPVETRLEQRKVVVAADGKEALAAVDSARPGDVIEYRASYRNTGAQAVRNLEATLPIPGETEWIPGSEKPAGARASVDGKSFGAMPLKRKRLVQGKEIEESIPAREIRYLRWSAGELAAGKTTVVSARVKVVDDRPVPPASPGGRK